MEISVSFTVDLAEADNEGLALLNTILNGGKPAKTRKPRKPMTDAQKKAFRAKMVAGQEAAAKVREADNGEAQPDPEAIAKAEEAGRKSSKKSAKKKAKK